MKEIGAKGGVLSANGENHRLMHMGFSQIDKIGNNANIDISGFTV